MTSYDIAILGSGITGAAIALALAKNSRLKIAVIEVKKNGFIWSESNAFEDRVSAISHSSKHFFKHLSVWETIKAKRVSPYHKMHVWDAKTQGEIHFDCQSVGKSELGFIIENAIIQHSLLECYSLYPNIDFLCPFKPEKISKEPTKIIIANETGQTLSTQLLIAADGADSWVRKEVGIEIKNRDYLHSAIVTTVKTEKPHQMTAWQRFLPTGPLAFLPLTDAHYSSIVWSAKHEYAATLMELDDNAFQSRLAQAFENRLGNIITISKRQLFPLTMRHAKQYVQEGIALIGDAAHTIHPLAGQGVNMGLLDAAFLADIILEAKKNHRQFASLATLRKYERARKYDTATMLAIVDGIKFLFDSDNTIAKTLRSVGLNFSDRMSFLKNIFIRYGLGERDDLPQSAK